MNSPVPVRLCACGCGTPLVRPTQKKFAARGHVLRVYGADWRNNDNARRRNAVTLARKRVAKWPEPHVDVLLRVLGERDALTRRQVVALRAAMAKVAAANYSKGIRAGYSTCAKRLREGRAA